MVQPSEVIDGLNIVDDIYRALSPYITYKHFLILKDLTTFFAGAFAASVLLICITGHLLSHGNTEFKDFGNCENIAVKFEKNKKRLTILNKPTSCASMFHVVLSLMLLRFSHRTTVKLQDITSARILVGIIFFFGVVLTILAAIFIFHPLI